MANHSRRLRVVTRALSIKATVMLGLDESQSDADYGYGAGVWVPIRSL